MGSSIPPRLEAEPVREALRTVSAALRSFPDRGMIVGDVAAIAHGVVRTADHIDATLATARELHLVFGDLERFELVPRIPEALEFARAHQVLLLRHKPSGVDVDLTLAWRPFELDALAAADDALVGTIEMTVARAEDLVIYKAVTWRPQDQTDVERLVALHGGSMDLDRIRRTVAEFAEALDEPGRLGEVEAVIQRGLGG